MPVYEYRCAECGHRFSMIRPMKESDAGCECPLCGAPNARRLISRFTAIGAGDGAQDCGPVG
jgi:putative FmdB family regulatory protein